MSMRNDGIELAMEEEYVATRFRVVSLSNKINKLGFRGVTL